MAFALLFSRGEGGYGGDNKTRHVKSFMLQDFLKELVISGGIHYCMSGNYSESTKQNYERRITM
jgi:hypothetical protein